MIVVLSRLPLISGMNGGGAARWMQPVIEITSRTNEIVAIAELAHDGSRYAVDSCKATEQVALVLDESAVADAIADATQVWCVDDSWLGIKRLHSRFFSNSADASTTLNECMAWVDRVYVPSQYLKSKIGHASTAVLPMVVEDCSGDHHPVLDGRSAITYPHRMVDGKGHFEAVRVVSELNRRGHSFELHFRSPAAWNGRRGMRLKSEIDDLAARWGVQDCIVWSPWVPYLEVCGMYSNTPAVCLTASALDESFCLTPIEALTHRVPSVSAARGAIGVEYGAIDGASWIVQTDRQKNHSLTHMLADAIEEARFANPDGQHVQPLVDAFSRDRLESAIIGAALC